MAWRAACDQPQQSHHALTGITVNGGDRDVNNALVIFNGTTGADAGDVYADSPAAATITGVGPAVTIATVFRR